MLGAPHTGRAQPAGKAYRVGFLSLGGSPTSTGIWQRFLDEMRELNYVEGRNLSTTLTLAEGKPERLPGLVRALLEAKVDVIVTTSTPETRAVKSATSRIPVVMTLVPDPVEQGLVASLARPGGNVTGLTSHAPGISQKYVELLREATPTASRFAVITRGFSPFPEIRREMESAAHQIGVALSYVEINGPHHIDSALGKVKRDGVSAIIAPLGAFTYTHRAQLVQVALTHRLPGIYWVRDFVEAGGLMSYGTSFGDLGRRAAYFVDKLFKGARPADLPIEQPTKFELLINLKTAKALGVTVPPALLARADHVIE
ncbi:MAG TPA: ABC transporter substrate-binding protein [Methylomirabilota bacterium]